MGKLKYTTEEINALLDKVKHLSPSEKPLAKVSAHEIFLQTTVFRKCMPEKARVGVTYWTNKIKLYEPRTSLILRVQRSIGGG